jgi:tetratricopeptide (TPR) repeat protein
MLVKGHLIAGRFEVRGDEEELRWEQKRTGWNLSFLADDAEPAREESAEKPWLLPGIDRQTGAAVGIMPLSAPWLPDALRTVTVARRVMELGLPSTIEILHADRGVVFADPPLVPQERPILPLEAAARCALEACEVVARLHAAGAAAREGGLYFGPGHLHLVQSGEWHIRWLVPGPATMRDILKPADYFTALERLGPIRLDVFRLAAFFFSLCPASGARGAGARLDSARAAALEGLTRSCREPGDELPANVASLARQILLLATPSEEMAARIAALPEVFTLPRLPLDCEQIIAGCEEQLAALPDVSILRPLSLDPNVWIDEDKASPEASSARNRREHLTLALAAAYHQRASRLWAARDFTGALRDVERAIELDPVLPYHTTRAVLLDALGRRADAYREIDTALMTFLAIADALRRITAAAKSGVSTHWKNTPVRVETERLTRMLGDVPRLRVEELLWRAHTRESPLTDPEMARAHATRGMIAFRAGSLEQARDDLRRAMDLHESAFHAHALGAVLYARGEVAAAAEAEERSVDLEPGNTRYRWALIMSLRKLGRDREARDHALWILDSAADPTAHRERFARLFDVGVGSS